MGQVAPPQLFDHRDDTGVASEAFDSFENVNLAYDKQFAPVLLELQQLLRDNFDAWPNRPGPGPDSVGYFEPEHRL
jgi:hypothetical protein